MSSSSRTPDTTHPAWAPILRDLPVQVLARMRSDRVLRMPAPPREPHTRGRPPRHGGKFVFGQPETWGTPDFSRFTGTGLAYDDNWAPITLGPDGTAYIGVFNGIVAVRDSA